MGVSLCEGGGEGRGVVHDGASQVPLIGPTSPPGHTPRPIASPDRYGGR